jgi:hypothetical protein
MVADLLAESVSIVLANVARDLLTTVCLVSASPNVTAAHNAKHNILLERYVFAIASQRCGNLTINPSFFRETTSESGFASSLCRES